MIPPEKIDEILSSTDIAALISRYVTLKPSGKNLKGLCPFHNEKTPSFLVHPDKGFYKCFGCGEGGGAIQFLMKIENLDFVEAVKILAEQTGVNIVTTDSERKALSEKEVLRKLMKTSVLYYKELFLNSPLGKDARAYLKKRDIDIKTAAVFDLGFAPESGDFLARHLAGRKFKYEDMERAGVVRHRGNNYYDYFFDRLIFPIADSQGRHIGMGGRGMSDDAVPKYLNTPQTSLFSKAHVLYGLHLAKQAIRHEEEVYVVEGYMDVIGLYGAGIQNAVASMGTSLTEEQAKGIARYTNRVIFAYDSDTAGEAATVRGIEIFEKAGLQVKIMSLPAGEDPDSIIRKKGS
jgi:DNA primase